MNELAVDVVKHGGKRPSEKFQPIKLNNSIISACLSARIPEGQADMIARSVYTEVEKWLENRPEITTTDIRIIVTKSLAKHHQDAAYLYEQDKKII